MYICTDFPKSRPCEWLTKLSRLQSLSFDVSVIAKLHAVFISNTFTSNARLKLAKN